MRRLLTTASKRSIKEAFKRNVVYRTIDAAYKEQETQMMTLRFSPEEILVNCFIGFDQILKNRDDIGEITCRMWDDIFCELRDDAQEMSRAFQDNELETATSCIIYSITACMMATNNDKLIRYTEPLMSQIAEHTDLNSVGLPFLYNTENNFGEYIQEYANKGKYISERLESPKGNIDPIIPMATPEDRTKAKNGVKKRLGFMKGCLPESETLIMTPSDYNKMIEAVEYLIENNVVKKLETKIHTHLRIADLRYTFYLVWKHEGKCVDRQLWLDFLSETFLQMQDNKKSLSNHFPDKPANYVRFLRPKKKK